MFFLVLFDASIYLYTRSGALESFFASFVCVRCFANTTTYTFFVFECVRLTSECGTHTLKCLKCICGSIWQVAHAYISDTKHYHIHTSQLDCVRAALSSKATHEPSETVWRTKFVWLRIERYSGSRRFRPKGKSFFFQIFRTFSKNFPYLKKKLYIKYFPFGLKRLDSKEFFNSDQKKFVAVFDELFVHSFTQQSNAHIQRRPMCMW